ncbi:MAG: type III pantothenate kinase [Burkholderiales bacterium]|nr:MAG: type III pantothenate kinase [Betaproteobacteria bacterium]TAG81278.1 MAG: type III pantothenate kinase [Burkholderiales bacterium]
MLALDIGNTRLKWAAFDHDVIVSRGAMFIAELDQFLDRAGVETLRPTRIAGSHVANAVTRRKIEEQLASLGHAVEWIESTASCGGVVNSYDDPARLGTDRWAALVASWQRKLGPCLVVSAGTALTIDQLDETGRFLGGAIVAGYHAMLGGLAGNTAALSVDAGDWTSQPRNTRDALATGAIDAMVGAIQASHARLAKVLHERGHLREPKVVLTGGSAYRLLPHLRADATVIDTLALEGVRLVALEASR